MTWRQNLNLIKLALKYPQISLTKVRHGLNKRLNKENNFPKLVRFFLFYGCNLRCRMCGQWGDLGVSDLGQIKNFLSIEKLKELTVELAVSKPEIYIWGGEPTLHPNFIEFLQELKKKKLLVTINTNGVLLEKYAEDILKNKIDSLDVSLIGTSEIHDEVVRVPGTYDKVMAGLDLIYKKSREYQFKPLIKAIITLNEINLKNVEKLLEEIETNLAIDMIIVQLAWFTNEKIGRAYEARMRQDFGVAATSWQGFQDEKAGQRGESAKQLVELIRQSKKYKKPILFFPNLKTTQVSGYFENHSDRLGYDKCGALEREIDIRHNGEVVICADYPDYVVGDVNLNSIREIWQGEKLNKFKNNIKSKGLLPVCSRCCALFR